MALFSIVALLFQGGYSIFEFEKLDGLTKQVSSAWAEGADSLMEAGLSLSADLNAISLRALASKQAGRHPSVAETKKDLEASFDRVRNNKYISKSLRTEIIRELDQYLEKRDLFRYLPNLEAALPVFSILAKGEAEVEDNVISRLEKEEHEVIASTEFWLKVVIFVAVLSILLMNWVSISKLLGGITGTSNCAKDLAVGEGNLTQRLPEPKNELGTLGSWMNRFLHRLMELVSSASTHSQEVAAMATEMAANSTQSAVNMRDVSDATTQVAAAVTEMAQTAEVIAESTNKANVFVGETVRTMESAQKKADQGRLQMESMVQKLEQFAENMEALDAESLEIGGILDVIRGIADQTNLLALNAAIEAARAGEQGRGFAVVADEVRSLAQRTQEATGEISDKLDGFKGKTRESREQSEINITSARETNETFSSIVDLVQQGCEQAEQISDRNNEVASAAEEQVAVTQEINRSVHEIMDRVQETAVGAEQSSKATESLAKVAEQLSAGLGQFKTSSQTA